MTKIPVTTEAMLVNYFRPYTDAIKGGYPFIDATLDDTTVVLLATSGIDIYLRVSILSRFRKAPGSDEMAEIFEGYGPLASFDSKIRLCAMLGLVVGDAKHDLLILKKIRNLFAHSPGIKRFSDSDIKSRCLNLKLHATLKKHVQIESVPKRHFIESCIQLHFHLAETLAFSMEENLHVVRHIVEITEAAQKRYNSFTEGVGQPPKQIE